MGEEGVKGPGEDIIVRLANVLLHGESPDSVPGLIINRGDGQVRRVLPSALSNERASQRVSLTLGPINARTPYTRRSGTSLKVDNLRYYWAATGRPMRQARFDEVLQIAGLGSATHRRVRRDGTSPWRDWAQATWPHRAP